jgi:peptidoglycan/xylan/chitin deacetylase (PgdA/CDA1 family)
MCSRIAIFILNGTLDLHEMLEAELAESRRQLTELCGQPITLFAYPTGDYDRAVIAAVQRAGYDYAFAVDRRQLGELRYEIPRIGIYKAASWYLDLKLSGLHRRPLGSIGGAS